MIKKALTYVFVSQVYAEESNTKEKFKSSNATITIQLTDVNDNNPVFNQSAYSFPVTDNSIVIGQVMYQILEGS